LGSQGGTGWLGRVTGTGGAPVCCLCQGWQVSDSGVCLLVGRYLAVSGVDNPNAALYGSLMTTTQTPTEMFDMAVEILTERGTPFRVASTRTFLVGTRNPQLTTVDDVLSSVPASRLSGARDGKCLRCFAPEWAHSDGNAGAWDGHAFVLRVC